MRRFREEKEELFIREKTFSLQHSPVKQMKITIPNCHISCVKSVLKKVGGEEDEKLLFAHSYFTGAVSYSLISVISFCVDNLRCRIRKPFVASLHHRIHAPRLAKITELHA